MINLKHRQVSKPMLTLVIVGLLFCMATTPSKGVMLPPTPTAGHDDHTPAFMPTTLVAGKLDPQSQLPKEPTEQVIQPEPTAPVHSVQAAQADSPTSIGGVEAQPDAWPWMAALISADYTNAYYGQFCGGSLISPQWVLTAAHCVQRQTPFNFDVVLGRHKLSQAEGERIPAARIIVHPLYNATTQDYDLALVQLARPSTHLPIALGATDDQTLENQHTKATVIGWGRINAQSYIGSDSLRQVELPLVARDVCNSVFAYAGAVTDNMICAGFSAGNKSACYGDSGGPLMVRKPQEDIAKETSSPTAGWTQIGIVSWGSALCSGENQYNVYTRVIHFQSWIRTCLSDPDAKECNPNNGQRDAYEPDDDINNAKPISSTGKIQFHTFHKPGDNDWVKVAVRAGVQYDVEIFDVGFNSDSVIWLYDSDGSTILARNDDSAFDVAAKLAAHLLWKAPKDETVYLQILALDSRRFGANTSYALCLQELNQLVFLPTVMDIR